MTLYVKAVVGPTSYLIEAARVSDVAPADTGVSGAVVDCRALFGAAAETAGYRLVVAADPPAPVTLIVDRIDGLVEIDADGFRKLPPIGRFGAAIDAVSVPAGDEAPMLRLSVGAALSAEMSAEVAG